MSNDITGWAQALLEFPNLVFCVIDTTSIKRDSDIIRLLTLNKHGFIENHRLIFSWRHPAMPNTEWTGITGEEMEAAPILSVIWPDIREALTGKYVLAYGFDFIQERLDENANHYGLPPIHLIGDCLMQTAPSYFRVNVSSMKLADACARIGHKLPSRPMALDRAEGQLALLKAMSQGITSVPAPEPISDDDEDTLGDLDSAIF